MKVYSKEVVGMIAMLAGLFVLNTAFSQNLNAEEKREAMQEVQDRVDRETTETVEDVDNQAEISTRSAVRLQKIDHAKIDPEHKHRAVPLRLNYQGYLTDDMGTPINATVTMVFDMYDAETGGGQQWTSGGQSVDVVDGLFYYILDGVPLVVFSGGAQRWLELTVEGEVLSPRTEITSSPWAYAATLADSALWASEAAYADSAGGAERIGSLTLQGLDLRYVNNGEAAGGDLADMFPSPTVVGLQTRPMASTAPTTDQILKWDGSQWAPGEDQTGGVGTITAVNAGEGLTGGGTSGDVTLDVGAGTAIVVNEDSVSLDTLWADTRYINDGGIAGGDLTGSYPNPNVDGLQSRPVASSAPSSGQVLKWDGTQWAPGNDLTGAGDNTWVRGTPDSVLFTTNYLGIARGGADNMLYGNNVHSHSNFGVACTTGVSGQDNSHITISGGYGNTAHSNYATISGGRENTCSWGSYGTVAGGDSNTVNADYATVSGGVRNTCDDIYATISGGADNHAMSMYATIAGGQADTAYGYYATISGGSHNYTGDYGATVSGGTNNRASGMYGVVGGGWTNTASGLNATVSGGRDNSANDNYTTVAGGMDNTADYDYASVGGGRDNTASNFYATVAGGYENEADGEYATVAGGWADTANGAWAGVLSGLRNLAGDEISDTAAVVVGGRNNEALANYSFVGGGRNNMASGEYATVVGGWADTTNAPWGGVLSGYNNRAGNGPNDTAAVVVGGWGNRATGEFTFVGGGRDNSAAVAYATVAGGYNNRAAYNHSTVVGGRDNTAFGAHGTIAGGRDNYIDEGSYAIIAGGRNNRVSGDYSAILGGQNDTVGGDYSMAFGENVWTQLFHHVVFFDGAHSGYFWVNCDYHDEPLNTWPILVGTNTSNGNHAHLSPGGFWIDVVARSMLENSEELSGSEILNKIKGMSITRWQFKETGERHIGPMGEDFYHAFGCGSGHAGVDSTHISATDMAGVSLIAIQELSQKIEILEAENQKLRKRIEVLEKQ